MSAIFLSHSSADAEAAATWKAWLSTEQNLQSVFLDFDPEAGIPAGRDWEGELYRRLRSCRALIVLCSPDSMASRWCFVEIALARSLGKPIFPVVIEPCDVVEVLANVQIIDTAEGLEAAQQRLARGLGGAGLRSADRFGWDDTSGRSPYPGLLAFSEEDAGVFFGRDAEIGEGLDRLTQLRRYQGSGLLMVLGASGSGKSSLVRAGLIPRLKQSDEWTVLPPFRPGNLPRQHLTRALADSMPAESNFDEEAFYRGLLDAPGPEQAAEALHASLLEVCKGLPDTRVILVLDQFEELLGQPDDHPAHDFLALLRAEVEREDSALVVMATMRSDYLGVFQSQSALRGMTYENLTLGPMSIESLRQMIERPAELADVQLEPALVDVLLQDADTDYALPLLAFTLRELYESYVNPADRTISLVDYQEHLGGLEGALKKAVERRLPAVQSEKDEAALRRAFLAMARLDDEGRVTRRAVPQSELEELMGGPDEVQRLLGPFLEGRLLRAGRIEHGEQTIEVTHEALFRKWDALVGWIREYLGDLKFRDRLNKAAEDWAASGESADDLLRHPVRLGRAAQLRDSRRVPMAETLSRYLVASEVEANKQQARITWRRRLIVGGALLVAIAMAFLWRGAVRAQRQAQLSEAEARAQVSRFLAAETARQDLDVALLLGIEAHRAFDTREARDALAAKVFEAPNLQRFLGSHRDWVTTLAAGEETRHLVSFGDDETVRLWDAVSGRALHRLEDDGRRIQAIALDRSGRRLASAHDDGSITIWEVDDSGSNLSPRRALRSEEGSYDLLEISGSGGTVAAIGDRGSAYLWSGEDGTSRGSFDPGGAVEALALDESGRLVATGHSDGRLRLWTASPAELFFEYVPASRQGGVSAVAFDTESGRVAWGYEDAADIHLCGPAGNRADDAEPGSAPTTDPCPGGPTLLAGPPSGVSDLAFHSAGALAASGLDGTVMVWSRDGRRLARFRQSSAIYAVAFVGERAVATGGRDQKIRIWSLDDPPMAQSQDGVIDAIALEQEGERAIVVSASGTLLSRREAESRFPESSVPTGDLSRVAIGRGLIAAGGGDLVVRVWNSAMDEQRGELPTEELITALAFHPTADQLAVGLDDGLVGLWSLDENAFAYSFAMSDSVSAVSFARDGAELAAGSYDGSLVLWQLTEGVPSNERRQVLSESGVASLVYSPVADRLAVGLENGDVLLRQEDSSFEPIPGHPGHEHPVVSLAFGPAGRYLASGSSNLQVWNLEKSRLEFTLPIPGGGGEIAGIAFAPDGRSLAVARRNTVWTVPLEVEAWVALACPRANRNLTESEWEEFMGDREWHETCAEATTENRE